MAAALAEGTTILENAAREPEIPDLARLLTAMGARIHGAGTERIEIEGVPELGGARHRIIPDRVEAGTFLVAGAITGGDIVVRDVVPDHLGAVLDKLEATGARLEIGADRIRIQAAGRPRPTDVVTNPFPGFATVVERASGLPTRVPVAPLYVTPLGIARHAPCHVPAPGAGALARARGVPS